MRTASGMSSQSNLSEKVPRCDVVDPRHLEPHEVVGVVGDSLRVGLRKAHPHLG